MGLGLVRVGLQQPGTVRPQRAVDVALDRAHREEPVGAADLAIVGQPIYRPGCLQITLVEITVAILLFCNDLSFAFA